MLSRKLNISEIFKRQSAVYLDDDTGKVSAADIITFFIVPALLAGLGSWQTVNWVEDILPDVWVVVTILVGFLVSALSILLTLHANNESQGDNGAVSEIQADEGGDYVQEGILKREAIVSEQLTTTIVYTVTVSIFLIIVSFSFSVIPDWKVNIRTTCVQPLDNAVEFVVLFMLIHILLLFVLVVKRLEALIISFRSG